VWVHDCDEDAAVQAIEGFLAAETALPTPDAGHAAPVKQVCTVNPEFVMESRRNRAFRDLLNAADLCTPDGVGIMLAARLMGTPLRGRATGVALVGRIAALSARSSRFPEGNPMHAGHRLFLLGARPGVAEEAAEELTRRYPGVNIVGTYPGSPDDADFPEIKRRLASAQPDVLLVAYGAPKQDLWVRSHLGDFPASVKVAMGIGGVLDYLAGRVPLAPPLMRRLGLEWLYRLIKQPWRWRRIMRVFGFGFLAVRVAIGRRISASARPRK
jgi:N-acetylglucosaminyldiphosphoundecaprenol N-acetyl-beta-D-mannosaminyltransferase